VIKPFSNSLDISFHGTWGMISEQNLEHLIYQVSLRPSCLSLHVDRIYYCFMHHLNEQLFGALIDLLIILNKRGLALSERLIKGSCSRLTENEFQMIFSCYKSNFENIDLLPSRYSVFSKGLLSTILFVKQSNDEEVKTYDALKLARDYIEYSQLDNATRILEQAILSNPERTDIHEELLLLYRSTLNISGFERFYRGLLLQTMNLPLGWRQLDEFFKGCH
jgi:hypothetical protein